MTNSILSCVWIKIYLTNQQWRSKILTLFCPQLFLLSLLCLCSITMTLNRPKNQYIFLLYKLYDSWVFNFSYQLPTLRNICASNNARPILKEKAGLWNEKVLLQFRPKSGKGAIVNVSSMSPKLVRTKPHIVENRRITMAP